MNLEILATAVDHRVKQENLIGLIERSGPYYHRALVSLGYGCDEATAIVAMRDE